MFLQGLFDYLARIDNFFWSYIGIYIVLFSGLYFSVKSKFYQLKILASLKKTIKTVIKSKDADISRGISPIKLYFTSVSGMVGLANIVAVTSAISLGGPGALLWLWIAAICGMLIKYSEIYLGIKYRVPHGKGGYNGGSIYYLKHAFKTKFVSLTAALLLGIYGVEIYQFAIVTESLTTLANYVFNVDKTIVMIIFLILVLYSSFGGIERLANICFYVTPIFIIAYIVVCLIVVVMNYSVLPEILWTVLKSAFTGHAPIGGFVGSTVLMAAQQGIARAVYSGDIAIGYDSIIQSETNIKNPHEQARLAILSVTTDTIICTLSALVVLVTGIWKEVSVERASEAVATALSNYVPHIEIFMAILIFLVGYTTIIAYLAVGVKCAKYLSPKYGYRIYFSYAVFAFIFFSYFNQSKLLLIMSITSGILVFINVSGIIKLRKDIDFNNNF